MKARIVRLLLLSLLALATGAAAQPPSPSGRESLERFFEEVERYTAHFNQVVLDETGQTIQEAKGRLWIERPNKFRWNYEEPYKQQIVSDGERLWVFDEDLRQVTVRPLAESLLETPAALLAGKGQLQESFNVADAGTEDGLAWVELTPKGRDSGFEKVRLGFQQGRLKTLELLDALGQTTRYTLHSGLENRAIASSRFTFTPPPGVDVVGGS